MFLNTDVIHSRVIIIVRPVTMLASGVLALHGMAWQADDVLFQHHGASLHSGFLCSGQVLFTTKTWPLHRTHPTLLLTAEREKEPVVV